jgi:hypothetical protein
MKIIRVPQGFRCPLCPDHNDDENVFAWSNLLQSPICWGCTYDLYYGIVDWEERPTLDQYNNAETIERLEQVTGFTFQQAKFEYLRELLEELSITIPEPIKGIDVRQMSEVELWKWNGIFDYELAKYDLVRDVKKYKSTWEDKFEHIKIKLIKITGKE